MSVAKKYFSASHQGSEISPRFLRPLGQLVGWDGWMASPTQWTWVWVDSGSWWWTGRPGVLRSMGSQRVGHNWAIELNWTEGQLFLPGNLSASRGHAFQLTCWWRVGEWVCVWGGLSGYPTKVLPLIQKPQITSLRGLQINVVLKFQFSNLVCWT